MLTLEKYKIKVEKAAVSKLQGVSASDLRFGRDFSDHMFISDFRNGQWGDHRVIPFADLKLNPATCAIHYGQAIFEGMKAYKGKDGKVRLFRPMENARRFNVSAERMCMPTIDEELFLSGLKQVLLLDHEWVPQIEGCSLYLRPFMFADEVFLGVKPSTEYKFMIICSPASSYYAEPLRVKIERHYSRASIGGVGQAKAAGNYAAAMYPTQLAAKQGYQQVIWTDSIEHKYIEEAGTMNLMFVIDGKCITPSLETGTILSGITRESVMELAKDLGYEVEERRISVDELQEAFNNGILEEAFGLGTAANITQIKSIGFETGEMELPPVETRKISNHISQTLSDIKYGEIEDRYGWTEIL